MARTVAAPGHRGFEASGPDISWAIDEFRLIPSLASHHFSKRTNRPNVICRIDSAVEVLEWQASRVAGTRSLRISVQMLLSLFIVCCGAELFTGFWGCRDSLGCRLRTDRRR